MCKIMLWYYFSIVTGAVKPYPISIKSVAMKKTILINLLLILAYYLFLQLLVAAFIRG